MVIPREWMASALASRQSDKEIDFRNCISRAYYAAYHAALLVADEHFPDSDSPQHRGSHQHLINRFRSSAYRPAKRLAKALKNMKLKRCRADYQVDETVTLAEADEALADAVRIQALLEACVPSRQLSDGEAFAPVGYRADHALAARPAEPAATQ